MSIKNSRPDIRFLPKVRHDFEVCFSQEVLDHFYKNRQLQSFSKEAGGQLFAKIHSGAIHVYSVTGPRKLDRRGRFFFNPIRWIENLEIKRKFNDGLHYVGDWHTHPQQIPEPSPLDIKSMKECFKKSKHELPFFILVIVGQVATPDGLSVSIYNETDVLWLCLSSID